MPRKIADLFYELRAKTEGLKKDLDEGERHLTRFSSFVAANPMATIAAFGTALVGIGAKAVLMAADVDRAMRQIQANLPRGESLGRLREEIAGVAHESGRAKDEVMGAAGEIARLGVGSADELAKRLRAVTLLADAVGATDLKPIADGLDQLMDAFGLTADQATQALAAIASAARGRTDIDALFAAFQAATPRLRELGIDANTATRALVALVDQGRNAKQAAKALNELDAAGIRELAKQAHVAGDAMKELQERADGVRGSLDRDKQRGLDAFKEKMEALGEKILPWVARELAGVIGLIEKLDGTEAKIIATSDVATVTNLGRLANQGKLKNRADQERLVNAGGRLIFAHGMGDADFSGMSKAELTELRAAFVAVENASRETGQRLSANWKPFIKSLDETLAKARDIPKAVAATTTTAPPKPLTDEQKKKMAAARDAMSVELASATTGKADDFEAKLVKSIREKLEAGLPASEVQAWAQQLRLAMVESLAKELPMVGEGIAEGLKGVLANQAEIDRASASIAAEITTTLVDDMQAQLAEKLAQMGEKGIPDALRKSFARSQGFLIGAQGISETVDQGLSQTDGIDGRLNKMKQLADLEKQIAAAALAIASGEGTAKEKAAAMAVLKGQLVKIEQKRGEVVKDQAAAEQASTATLREHTKKVGQEIHNAASFAYGLAEAFGLANSELGQLLVSVMQLGEGIANLASGNIMQGTVQTVGALINIGKKLFGGESSEDRRRREQAQNSVAQLIDGIRGEIHGTTSLASRLQGGRQEFANARQQVEEQLAGKKNEAERERRLRELNALEKERLAQLTQEFIVEQQQAKEDYEVRRLRATGHEEEAQALADAEAAQREYSDAVAKGADELTLAALAAAQAAEAADRAAQAERRAREKRIERADQENEIFDVTDPKARLARRGSVYQGFGGALGGLFEGLDLTKEADVAKLDERVKELFRTLETAPDSVDLAGMSIEELISVLLGLDSACDDVAAGVQSAADAFNEAVNSLSVDAEIAGSADPTGAAQGIAGAAGASFSEISNALAGIDLSTEEGRKKAESALQELYAAHKDNKPLVDAIRQVLRAIRAVPVATPVDPSGGEARGSAGGGGHESLANAAMGLTQAVGSRMADYLASIDIGVKHLPADLAAELAAWLTPVITGPVFPPALPSSMGAAPGRRGLGDGGTTFSVQVYLQLEPPDGSDPRAWGDAVGQSIGQSVNRELADWFRGGQIRSGNLDRVGVS